MIRAIKQAAVLALALAFSTILCKSQQAIPAGLEKAPVIAVIGVVEKEKDGTVRIMENAASRSRVTHTVHGPLVSQVMAQAGKTIHVKGNVIGKSPFDKDIYVREIVPDSGVPGFP